jgi:branched-chain amino acid transport system ATP-binding protein
MSDLGIEDAADRQASTLPYGLQRKLEIARALAGSPKLILLDEPAAGMNDGETAELGETIIRVARDFAVTALIIEHHINLVMDICSHVVVMERGALLASGAPDEIRGDPRVIEAYLGRRHGRARQ